MKRIRCDFEDLLKDAGYILIYDGQTARQRENDPTSLKPEDRRFFTRIYQQVKNNRPTDKYAKLIYDARTGYFEGKDNIPYKKIAMELYEKAPNGLRATQQRMVSQEA